MMNAGQMLLEGFTGLFKKAEDELSVLYDYFRRLKSHDASTTAEQDNQQEKNLKVSHLSYKERKISGESRENFDRVTKFFPVEKIPQHFFFPTKTFTRNFIPRPIFESINFYACIYPYKPLSFYEVNNFFRKFFFKKINFKWL